MTDKIDLASKSVRQLRSRRRVLVKSLPDIEGLITGSVVDQGRRCGKEGCRCTRGELHGPYTYVVLPRIEGRTRTVYVPQSAAEAVRHGVTLSIEVQETLQEISAINIELLTRRKLP